MSKESIELAVAKAEHMLQVLKRMKDDPQGDTGGLYRTAEEALLRRVQAVVGDLQELVESLNEHLPPALRFDMEITDLADKFRNMEVEDTIQ
jgi:hypothetical protein